MDENGAGTVTALGRALRTGVVTSTELVAEALAAAQRHAGLGVFVEVFAAQAISAARAADRELAAGRDRGPLHGIPLAVKDVIATREAPTTAGSSVPAAGLPAGRDAAVVHRARTGGAIVLGKTSTTELGCGLPDPDADRPLPQNPWDTDRWAGGSSSGSAAGVAAGMFPVALGGDSAGSIRVPAAFCGVTGLAPTFGLVTAAGCVPLGPSVDRIGPLARTATDCAAVLPVLTGSALPNRPLPRELRIGVVRATGAAVERALDVLAGLGARLVEVELPHEQQVVAATMVTIYCEGLAHHRPSLVRHWDDHLVSTRGLLARGALVSGADYVRAQELREVARRALAALFTDVDVVVTPTASIGAPRFADVADRTGQQNPAVFGHLHTPYWNGVGNPVLAVPIGPGDDALPRSLQIAGPVGGDGLVLQVGALFQDYTDWHTRRPPTDRAEVA